MKYPALTSFLEGEVCKTTYCLSLQFFSGNGWMLCGYVCWVPDAAACWELLCSWPRAESSIPHGHG